MIFAVRRGIWIYVGYIGDSAGERFFGLGWCCFCYCYGFVLFFFVYVNMGINFVGLG